MTAKQGLWDYLIVTASNPEQAAAYDYQLRLRKDLGLLAGAERVVALSDPEGRRIGSGGSTLFCLAWILAHEGETAGVSADAWLSLLGKKRILIVHAGGDSRRLPAYGPCGKAFVPVPGDSDSALGTTLFDRQIGTFLKLPSPPTGGGQVVITAGDVLLTFAPGGVSFARQGVTGLGCPATPRQASAHGVFCVDAHGGVTEYLQKPSPEVQEACGGIDDFGRSILDIGVFSFDPATAVRLLSASGIRPTPDGQVAWDTGAAPTIWSQGLDFYRELCCALGNDTRYDSYAAGVRSAGCTWSEPVLSAWFEALSDIPMHVEILPECGFLHFGTTRQMIDSGLQLLRQDRGFTDGSACLVANSHVSGEGALAARRAWVEGCRIDAAVSLTGSNVLVGVDVDSELELPEGACLDIIEGRNRAGQTGFFVRCYGVGDQFKRSVADGGLWCGIPLAQWLRDANAETDGLWPATVLPEEQSCWNARLFPWVPEMSAFRKWLWLYRPGTATPEQQAAWRDADRYSLAEIALARDQVRFNARREQLHAQLLHDSRRRLFLADGGFSTQDLVHVLASSTPCQRRAWTVDLLAEAHWHYGPEQAQAHRSGFVAARVLHTLGTALQATNEDDAAIRDALPGLLELHATAVQWLRSHGVAVQDATPLRQFAAGLRDLAFRLVSRTIIASSPARPAPPRNALRPDEIVWGRAPARLDFGGGWSDTPPYSLEHGGCVLNAAVDLNGQPPIHCYARVIKEPVIRIASIDLGVRIELTNLESLLDFRSATSEFALAKAALALSAFAPDSADWPAAASLRYMLEHFGGGIELTTLAAIPKGSGLGTSSIVGAVILAVVQRLMGRELSRQELFNGVLRLEQALTTGGGWQDQVGGVVDGVKLVSAPAGLVPATTIHYLPGDLVDPRHNGGVTLLYYTGITRLAKNVLQRVVGRYLDRNRATMAALQRIHAMPPRVADALGRRDMAAFGTLIGEAWEQNRRLDPNSTNEAVDRLMARVEPHAYGAKLAGAGGGGFLFVVCRSPAAAQALRQELTEHPPNERARFFDFSLSSEGLVVSAC